MDEVNIKNCEEKKEMAVSRRERERDVRERGKGKRREEKVKEREKGRERCEEGEKERVGEGRRYQKYHEFGRRALVYLLW